MMEGSGERATGTPNTIYDLSSVLFHALEGGASYDQYVQDAEEAGDEELANFFRQVRDEDAARADEAQILIAERTPAAGMDSGTVPPEGMAGGMPASAGPAVTAPGTEPIAEDVPPPPREEPLGGAPGTEPIGEEPLTRTVEEVPPPRASGMQESSLPRTEETPPPPMTEDRPLGTEGTMPPRTEEAPSRGGDIPPRTGDEPPLGEQASSPRGEREQDEDRGLLNRVKDALSSEEEERGRREGRDEPPRR